MNKKSSSQQKPSVSSSQSAHSNDAECQLQKPIDRSYPTGAGLENGPVSYAKIMMKKSKKWKQKTAYLTRVGYLVYYPPEEEHSPGLYYNSRGKAIDLLGSTVRDYRCDPADDKSKGKTTKKWHGLEIIRKNMDPVYLQVKIEPFMPCVTKEDWKNAIATASQNRLQAIMNPIKTGIDTSYLKTIKKNNECAECADADPTRVSKKYGILLCIQCGNIFNELKLDTDIVKLDSKENLTLADVQLLYVIGNENSNFVLERTMPKEVKPKPNSDKETKKKFIKNKYIGNKFLPEPDDYTRVFQPLHRLFTAINHSLTLEVIRFIAQSKHLINNYYQYRKYTRTPVQIAAKAGQLAYLHLLVKHGARIDGVDNEGCDAVKLAEKANFEDCKKYLLHVKQQQKK